MTGKTKQQATSNHNLSNDSEKGLVTSCFGLTNFAMARGTRAQDGNPDEAEGSS